MSSSQRQMAQKGARSRLSRSMSAGSIRFGVEALALGGLPPRPVLDAQEEPHQEQRSEDGEGERQGHGGSGEGPG
jgi:hypothetical protein